MDTVQIPTEVKEADNLPKEHALSYNEIALVVGSLYLDSHHKISSMNKDFDSIIGETRNLLEQKTMQLQTKNSQVQSLENKIQNLENENFKLQHQLNDAQTKEKDEPVDGPLDESNNDGNG